MGVHYLTIVPRQYHGSLHQGRLKLRVVNDYAQLLFYVREDVSGPKESTFQVAPVSDPDALRTTLGWSLVYLTPASPLPVVL